MRYDDGRVRLDRDGNRLAPLLLPARHQQHIPYHRIHHVGAPPMGWLTGKGRAWGTAHPGYWLPLDASRPRKNTLVVLDLGGHVKPAFTPDEPDTVLNILAHHTQR